MTGKKVRPAGSLKTGEPAFLAAGKIRRPHGVGGDVLVDVYTDFPERLQAEKTVFLGEDHQPVIIRRQREHNEGLLLGFEGYDTPEAVGIFRNQMLYVNMAEAPELQAGEYYFHEVIGLQVWDEEGILLGKVSEIIETGANDVYVVTTPTGEEILLPAIPEVIKLIDIPGGRMIVHLLPGLLDETSDD